MLYKIILLLLIGFPLGVVIGQSTTVSETEASTVASNWLNTIDDSQSYTIQDVLTNLDYDIGEDLTFYVVRYSNPAFVIVPATKFVRPILAYSTNGGVGDSFNEGETHGAFYLFSSYNRAIEIHQSTETYMSVAQTQWNTGATCTGANSNHGGAALLEHYHTSRWMARDEIFNCMTEFNSWPNPNQRTRGYNTCVPTALSQIIKYFQHPYQGNTIIPSYSHNAAINHQTHLYDYEIMPFKSGNWGIAGGYGQNPNLGGSNGPFDLYYPYCGDGTITTREDAPTMSQMGQLIFNAGSSSEMSWFYGTANSFSGTWATKMSTHFDYNFSSNNSIATQATYYNIPLGNTILSESDFKNKLRLSILNERPVLFGGFTNSGGGHAFLLDGFQCDDFFHVALGFSGEYDGYYYIFTADANGTYGQLSYQYGQSAAVDIHPNCNLTIDITINNQTYTSEELEQAQNNITANNATIQTGAKTFMIGGNSVELTSDVEVQLGGELFINIETCGVPKPSN